MEYLLREKLERLVQSEIEARVARMHQVKKKTVRCLPVFPRNRCDFLTQNTSSASEPLDVPTLPDNA